VSCTLIAAMRWNVAIEHLVNQLFRSKIIWGFLDGQFQVKVSFAMPATVDAIVY
jgi:hypothetical protein